MYSTKKLQKFTNIIHEFPFNLVAEDGWFWCNLLECVMNFCILKTAKYTVYDFLSDIHATERIDVLEKEAFGVIISLYALGMLLAKVLIFNIFCVYEYDHAVYCKINPSYLIFYTVYFHGMDSVHDAQIIIRYYIYAYVKNMKRSLHQDQNLNKFIEQYDKIVDCQDKIRRLCDYLVSLFIKNPDVMVKKENFDSNDVIIDIKLNDSQLIKIKFPPQIQLQFY